MKKMLFADISSKVYDALLLDGYPEEHLELCVDEVKGYIGYKDDMAHESFNMFFGENYIRFVVIHTSDEEAYAKETVFRNEKKFYEHLYKTECIYNYEIYQHLMKNKK